MKLIKTLIICNIAFISACGGSDSPSGNTPAAAESAAIDGPVRQLTADEDGFITTEGESTRFQDIEVPEDQDFTASKQQQLTITSAGGTSCHINVYSRFNKAQGNNYSPSAASRIIQMYSDTCEYSGTIYILNQQQKLLVEVINLNLDDTTSYYEKLIDNKPIEVAVK